MPQAALQPVHDASTAGGGPQPGTGLCMSGGGYRAMLFHAGCLWRLNQLGILGTLKRISSVSGGSITSGILGMNWVALGISAENPIAPPDRFAGLVIAPVRKVASTTIDESTIFGGIFLPGTIADHVADKYDSLVFHGRTLQDLPADDAGPRFVINATNVQSGVLIRFSRPYIRDYRVGQVLNPALPLARAVGASSAFPPVLSPAQIDLARYGLHFEPADGTEDLHTAPYTTTLVLSDGGVYDNLGLETVWKEYQTILVSDGGGHVKPEPDPHHDWARHAYRVLDIIDSQVRALRTRQLVEFFNQKVRDGAYWGIGQDITTYENPPVFPCPVTNTTGLAQTPTRLQKMDDTLQERLINWGYAVCDASVRKHLNTGAPKPEQLPYPGSPI